MPEQNLKFLGKNISTRFIFFKDSYQPMKRFFSSGVCLKCGFKSRCTVAV
jgi:hypothetical protein